jgi:hypothetical protein
VHLDNPDAKDVLHTPEQHLAAPAALGVQTAPVVRQHLPLLQVLKPPEQQSLVWLHVPLEA